MRGCLVFSSAGLVLSGTICPGLWRNRCLDIAQDTGFDFILLGFDPLRGGGVSVDILPPDGGDPLIDYLVWRSAGRDLWFIPSKDDGPYVCTGDWGIRREATLPATVRPSTPPV